MAELSEALLSVLPSIRVPKAGDRVHKDECAFSFDTPVSAPRGRPARLAGLPTAPARSQPTRPSGCRPRGARWDLWFPGGRGGPRLGGARGPRGLQRPACLAPRPSRPRRAGGCSSGAGAGVGRSLAPFGSCTARPRAPGERVLADTPTPPPRGGMLGPAVMRGARGRGSPRAQPLAAGGGPGVPPCPGLSCPSGLTAWRGPAGGGRVGAVSLRWQWSLPQPSPPRRHPCSSLPTPAWPRRTWEGPGGGRARPPPPASSVGAHPGVCPSPPEEMGCGWKMWCPWRKQHTAAWPSFPPRAPR